MLTIRKLVWDSWNVSHIARHNVIPEEVEEVCHGSPLLLVGQQRKRLVLIGPTDEKRMVTAILQPQGRGKYYPITAYDASPGTISLYNRLKGGEEYE